MVRCDDVLFAEFPDIQCMGGQGTTMEELKQDIKVRLLKQRALDGMALKQRPHRLLCVHQNLAYSGDPAQAAFEFGHACNGPMFVCSLKARQLHGCVGAGAHAHTC